MTSLCFPVFHSYTLPYSWHPQNVGVFYFTERTDENVAIKINRLCIRNINHSSYRVYDSSYRHGYL